MGIVASIRKSLRERSDRIERLDAAIALDMARAVDAAWELAQSWEEIARESEGAYADMARFNASKHKAYAREMEAGRARAW